MQDSDTEGSQRRCNIHYRILMLVAGSAKAATPEENSYAHAYLGNITHFVITGRLLLEQRGKLKKQARIEI